ncbi:MAG: FtsX-like permease family protein [Salinivirgaceae bacterium]|nr:FtsX-like permease family protein [Salinivirgaceae bacterium]
MDIPKNSTLQADCFINDFWSIDEINKAFNIENSDISWEHDFWTTWIIVNPNIDIKSIEYQLEELLPKHFDNPNRNYSLQCLSDVYLHSSQITNTGAKGDIDNLKFLIVIAFLIILIATINYIILSTVITSARAKEIFIRKLFGAKKKHINFQFLMDSTLIVLMVFPIAIVLMLISLPFIDKLFQAQILIIKSNVAVFLLISFSATLLVATFSSFIIPLILSKLKLFSINKSSNIVGRKKHLFQRFLIITQLVIFCSFVTCTLLVRSQYNYALKIDPGFYNQNIILINVYNSKGYKAFLNIIETNPYVIKTSGAMLKLPSGGSMAIMLPHSQKGDQKIKVEKFDIDFGYLETMGLKLIKGRDFSRQFGNDLQNSCILNETAVKQLGITKPIGKQLGYYNVIGVVKDFNLHSIHNDIPPLMITLTEDYIAQAVISYRPGNLNNLIPFVKESWEEIFPEKIFAYSRIEDLVEQMYSNEQRLSIMFSIFTLVAFIVASFGLFGLTLYIAQSRTKEIGIKKVIGCSERSIVFSFIKDNIINVFIATLISIPITVFLMSDWLNSFSYKITIEWWIYGTTFLLTTVLIIITVFTHSYRAAKMNPTLALRLE